MSHPMSNTTERDPVREGFALYQAHLGNTHGDHYAAFRLGAERAISLWAVQMRESLAATPAQPVEPPAGSEEFGNPRRAMNETELQEFCIALSFQQDDYTEEVIRSVERRMLAQPLFVPAAQPVEPSDAAVELDANESDAGVLWAEIWRLRHALEGPEGFATWQDAATAERVCRVELAAEVREVRAALAAAQPVPDAIPLSKVQELMNIAYEQGLKRQPLGASPAGLAIDAAAKEGGRG